MKKQRASSPRSLSDDKARRVVREVSVFRHRLATSIQAELKQLAMQKPTKQYQAAFSHEHQLLTSALAALRQPVPDLPLTKETREFEHLVQAVAEEDPLLWADVLGEK